MISARRTQGARLALSQVLEVPGEVREKCQELVRVSARRKRHLDDLHAAVWRAAVGEGSLESQDILLTSLRHRECVSDCRSALGRGIEALETGLSEEYALYDLRRALEALGRLTGEVSLEDILGEIFSTFCIGK